MNLTIGQLVKIILGIFVVAVVVIGLGFFFKDYFIDFIKNLSSGEIILGVLR